MTKKPSPDEAVSMLKEGNKRFVAGQSKHPHTDSERLMQAGTEDQRDHAYATIVTCSDSRVPVERIFDAGIMDIFVIRVIGNVCDLNACGSAEYGLVHVKTPVLVVLGHTQCGAVTAATRAVSGKGQVLEGNVRLLVENIEPAVRRAMKKNRNVNGEAIIPEAIRENVWQGIEKLFMVSRALRHITKSGKAKIVGAIYDVSTGKVEWLPETKVDQIREKAEKNPACAKDEMGAHGSA